jgi:hypothetical protein
VVDHSISSARRPSARAHVGADAEFDSDDHLRPGNGSKFFFITSIRVLHLVRVMFRSFATFGRRCGRRRIIFR